MSESEELRFPPMQQFAVVPIEDASGSILPVTLFVVSFFLVIAGSFLLAGFAARRSGPWLWLITAPAAGGAGLVVAWVVLRLLFS